MIDLPILLTSSVEAMDTSGKLNDPDLRIKYTLKSIDQWGRINPCGRFIICDGSNFNFSEIVRAKFPSLKIECIHFLNNYEMLLKHGKGFGEGEIIQYAIKNSSLIDNADAFVKCTGKLWVSNYYDCVNQWNGKFLASAYFANVFSLKQLKIGYLDTRFYIANKNYFLENFGRAHLGLGGENGLSIEDTYLSILLEKKEKHFLFGRQPIICGVGGGSGKFYKNSFRRILKDRLRNWVIKNDSNYRDLFISS